LNMHLGPLIILEKKEAPEVLKAKDSSSDPFGVTLTDQRGNAVGFFFTSVSVLSARNLISNSGNKLTSYCIEVETTEGKSWTVWQRYNSFYELDRNLRKRFEGVRTLPPKTIVRNRFDSNVIKHRCAQLHSYLQPLIKGPTAFDPALLSFLGCADRGHKDAHSSAVPSSLVMLPNQLNRRTAQIQLVHTATVQSPLRTMGAAPPPYEAPDVTNLASPRDTSRPRRKKGSNNNNNNSSSSSSMNNKSKHYKGSRSRSHKSPRDGSDKPSSSPSSSSQTTSGKRKTPSRGTGSNHLSSDPASSRPKSEAKPASKPRRPRSRATQLTLTAPPGINNNNNHNDDNANANSNISIANTNAPSTDCTSQPSPDPAPSDLPGNLPPERYLDEMFKRYSGQKLFLANARSVQRSGSSRRRATLQHSVSEDSLHEKYHLEAPEDAFQSASNLSAALDLNSSVVEHRDF
ncbi:MAG: PX domain-containing protein, partial [archaeon]|nr:PX domain-containing protein [archaeon]